MSSLKPWPYTLALVTGASSGLGRALAIEIAKRGTPLILTGRNKEELELTARMLSVKTTVLDLDLNIPQERQKLVALIQEQAPDLILNNAGLGHYGDALTTTTAEQLEIVEVNITSLVEITLEASRTLVKKRKPGTILNVASAAAFFPYPTLATYAASKAFVLQFSKALDVELFSHGIRVLTSCPGQTATSFRRRAGGNIPQKQDAWTMRSQDVASCILKQIEDQASVRIIDWRYRLWVTLARFVPKSILMKFLKESIRKRHHRNTIV
ncbi:MAG: SDR family NAD(P)-dependent oxidoreductase [Rhabdochlamydiaceae bacterium]|nr:SDR family NAD(P)-dependent oxidoreductase [Rhabdochlamydiaceae bacterium]